MCSLICVQCKLLLGGLVRDAGAGPDLAMRMRIARSHHRAAVFENLNVIDKRQCTQFLVLLSPEIHDSPKLVRLHPGHGHIVPRRKADHATNAGLAARCHQSAIIETSFRGPSQQRGIIVIENQVVFILGISLPRSTRIPRTHVTRGIICRRNLGGYLLDLSQPRALIAMRGNQDPFTR